MKEHKETPRYFFFMKEYKVIVYRSRTEWFNLEGQLHREDGPAREWSHGDKHWFLNGKRHREDGPACEFIDGSKAWFVNGKKLTEEEFNEIVNTNSLM